MTIGIILKILLTWALLPFYSTNYTSTECETGLTHHVESILDQKLGLFHVIACLKSFTKVLEEQITQMNLIPSVLMVIKIAQKEISFSCS